jgi:EAL domain-containing protein (putative c-di-GMP-specific phosphodiesterase class I)
MAHELGHAVVAEGIERKEQLAVLQELRCDFVQGYLLGKPMPDEELTALARSTAVAKRSLQVA